MDVTIAVIAGEDPREELRSLQSWLVGDEDLTGMVAPVDGQVITVAVNQPGAAAALANALVSWIRDHNRDVNYEVARPDGVSVRVSARRVRETDGAMVRDLISELCRPGRPETDTELTTSTAGGMDDTRGPAADT